MTFEQLVIFIAVAEREHLTRAADAIHLTPSAVSSAIKALERSYSVELFHRVGRRIELTPVGRAFLEEARATVNRVRSAELVLSEFGSMQRGKLNISASQTIATYRLAPLLMQFHQLHPGIDLNVSIGNTRTVADAVVTGESELGFVEGQFASPLLASTLLSKDALAVLVSPAHPWASRGDLTLAEIAIEGRWLMRERGSGTRSEFEAALIAGGILPESLNVVLELPSNEAILSGVQAGLCVAAISSAAADLHLRQKLLAKVTLDLPSRDFRLLRHKERQQSKAAKVFEQLAKKDFSQPTKSRLEMGAT